MADCRGQERPGQRIAALVHRAALDGREPLPSLEPLLDGGEPLPSLEPLFDGGEPLPVVAPST